MTETMTNEELDTAIASRPYPKVTKESIQSMIDKVDYMVFPNTTVTLCNITLKNGFSVRGESACVDPRNFNMQIGQEIAYRNAFAKLWELEGYLLAQRNWLSGDMVPKPTGGPVGAVVGHI